jgi:hypothetical protein
MKKQNSFGHHLARRTGRVRTLYFLSLTVVILSLFSLGLTKAFGQQWVANYSFVCVTNPGALPRTGGYYTGPGVVGSGTYWNYLTKVLNTTLETKTNSSALADDGVTSLTNVFVIQMPNMTSQGAVSYLLDSYTQADPTNTPYSFSFTNIPNGSYDLVLFGQNGEFAHANRGCTFTVNGQSKTATNSLVTSSLVFVENGNYVKFTAVPVTNNSLAGTYSWLYFQKSGYFNGLQLQYNGPGAIAPIVSAVSPASLTVPKSVTAQFSATVSGSPTPGVYWQFSSVSSSGPWVNVSNSGTVSGANSNVLTIANAQPAQAGYYQLVATNAGGTTLSSPAGQLAVAVLPSTWIANFDVDSYYNGFVGTYASTGAIGSGIYWNSVDAGALNGGTFTSASGILDDGTTAAGVTMTVNAGQCHSQNPVNNTLLDDYAQPVTGGSSLFSFNNLPNGVYNIVLYAAPGTNEFGGTRFNINGISQATVNVGNDTNFVVGQNYVLFTGIPATNGTISGTYARTTTWGALNGAQLQYTGTNAAPTLYNSPANQTTLQTYSASFSVGVSGYPLNYQWQSGPATNGPFSDLSNSGNVTGANTSTLSLTNLALSQAGYYRVVVTNSLGSVTSSLAKLTLTAATNLWTVNYDFDSSNPTSVGTYASAGLIGTAGTYWNSVPLTNPTNGLTTNLTVAVALSDDGVTNRDVALMVEYQGSFTAPGTVTNLLLDDYMSNKTNNPVASLPFVITNLPNGVYSLVLYSEQGAFAGASTTFYLTNTGTAQSCINGAASSDILFALGGNYAQFPIVYVTNGMISGTWSYIAPRQAVFSGFQVQYLGTAGMTSVTPVTPGIGQVVNDGNGFSFSVTGANGQSYTVLTSTNIAAPTTDWTTNAQGVFGPSGIISITNAPPLDVQRFFKVRTP